MPRAARLSLPRERRASWRIDFTLLFAAFALFGFGCLALRSVGIRSGENFLSRHLMMAGLGLGPFGVFYFVRPDWWRRSAWTLYGLNLVILAAVLFMGTSTNGAQRWLDLKFMQFQPSELAKMMALLTLASFLAARQDTISRVSTFILSFVHVAVPAFLIGMQPHYGGALVLIVIWLCVCVAGNVPLKFIAAAVLLLGLGGVAATQIPGALHGYHLRRLQAMQGEDRQGTNFQQDKAQVALAVGGLTGAGLFKGAQRLPEQENDFIFTVVGEDVGLAGSALVLGAFAFFFFRIWLVMVEAVEANHRMIAAGVLGLLAFHTIVNIGMVLQLLPVVGLWLPFFSAGGTALWLCMACVGLLLRVGRETRKRGF